MGVSAFVYCTCTEILPSRSLLLRLMRFRGIVSRRKTCLAESHTDELASRLSLCKLQLQRRGCCSCLLWRQQCCDLLQQQRFCVLLRGLLFSSLSTLEMHSGTFQHKYTKKGEEERLFGEIKGNKYRKALAACLI